MKTRTKALLLVMSALLLVVSTVFATMAFLVDKTETVKNTFTVGKVAIALDETDVDIYGVKESDTRVKANDYKLIPGHEYIKDPTVHVKSDSEECYVRMIVTVTVPATASSWIGTGIDEIIKGYDASVWNRVNYNVTTDDNGVSTIVYEYRYTEEVVASEITTVVTINGETYGSLEPLFTGIVVPESYDNEEIIALNSLNIDIVAHAIQADGFEGSADAAWAAFDAQVD